MTGLYRTLATVSPPRDRGALLVVLQAAIRAGAVPRELGAWLTATLEDILEQLLGPIPDQYGAEGRDAIRVVGEGVAIVGAAAGLHEIERLLDVRFPTNSVVSIGGLVYDRLGRVPQPGDIVELPGMRIEVLSVDGVRLRELRIRAGVGLSASASDLVAVDVARRAA